MSRRFPPPWTPRRLANGYEVCDARGQRLALIQGLANEFAALNIGALTLDEARRIAIGIARIPERVIPTRERLPAVIEVFEDRGGPPVEVALICSGQIGLEVFDAVVKAMPGRTLMLSNGTHRLRLHKPE